MEHICDYAFNLGCLGESTAVEIGVESRVIQLCCYAASVGQTQDWNGMGTGATRYGLRRRASYKFWNFAMLLYSSVFLKKILIEQFELPRR